MLQNDDLTWDVRVGPVSAGEGVSGTDRYQAIIRDDNDSLLAIAGSRYVPVLNSDLRELAEIFAGEAGAQVRGSWSVKGGRVVGLQLENGLFHIPGDPSEYRTYFTVANSHDGSTPLVSHPTSIRVVCQNTFFYAMNDRKYNGYRFRHTEGIHDKIKQVKEAVVQAHLEREGFTNWAQTMMERGFNPEIFINHLIPASEAAIRTADEALEEARETLRVVLKRPTNDGIRESVWGAINAGVEYLDHFEKPRRVTKNRNERLLLRTIGLAPGKEKVVWAARAAMI